MSQKKYKALRRLIKEQHGKNPVLCPRKYTPVNSGGTARVLGVRSLYQAMKP